ncbi:MAG: hypothetical protein JWP97_2640 [Labilithrix sp.]|nr:hypothetical protein [Labilithrix sp.]
MAKRERTERREAERQALKMAKARMKLAALEAGGGPDRPIEVTSASIIEPHASSMHCASCDNPGVRVEEHVAETLRAAEGEPERRLRVVHVRCPRCGTRRPVYFRIGTALAN